MTLGWSLNAFIYLFIFCLFRAASVAYGRSQARGWIGAVAAGHSHRHSNVGSAACTDEAHGNARSLMLKEAKDWTCVVVDTSWVRYPWAKTGTPWVPLWDYQRASLDGVWGTSQIVVSHVLVSSALFLCRTCPARLEFPYASPFYLLLFPALSPCCTKSPGKHCLCFPALCSANSKPLFVGWMKEGLNGWILWTNSTYWHVLGNIR